MATKRGTGKCIRWIREHADYSADECLIWPFSTANGYGNFGHLGELHYAHRFMCDLVHGPAPSDRHQASHSCGQGHKGCVNPRHLSWKTYSENQLDRARHGTKATGPWGKLTPEKAAEIRSLRGKLLQREIAEQYGVSRSVICNIQCNRAWPTQRTRRWKINP